MNKKSNFGLLIRLVVFFLWAAEFMFMVSFRTFFSGCMKKSG